MSGTPPDGYCTCEPGHVARDCGMRRHRRQALAEEAERVYWANAQALADAHRHLAAFEKEHGRMPNLLELVMLREAITSVNIDKDVGTYVVEDAGEDRITEADIGPDGLTDDERAAGLAPLFGPPEQITVKLTDGLAAEYENKRAGDWRQIPPSELLREAGVLQAAADEATDAADHDELHAAAEVCRLLAGRPYEVRYVDRWLDALLARVAR